MDFRELNKWIEVNPFPLLRINETMQKLEKLKLGIARDLSLGFYTITLDEVSQNTCVTILPWGKYSYLWMPVSIVYCVCSVLVPINHDRDTQKIRCNSIC